MRNSPHDKSISLRIGAEVRAQLGDMAKREGISVSAVLRRAAEREVAGPTSSDAETPTVAIEPNGALGASIAAIVRKAAKGDIDCQRYLFRDRLNALLAIDPPNGSSLLIAMETVALGRFLASHGGLVDNRNFAAALLKSAKVFRAVGCTPLADFLMAETISVLEQMAECGDDVAALSSQRLIKREAPELLEQVRTLRQNATQYEEQY